MFEPDSRIPIKAVRGSVRFKSSLGMLKVYSILLPFVALKIIFENFKMSLESMTPETLTNLNCSKVVLEKSTPSTSYSFLLPKISLALKSKYL